MGTLTKKQTLLLCGDVCVQPSPIYHLQVVQKWDFYCECEVSLLLWRVPNQRNQKMGPQLISNSFNSSVVLHDLEICIHLKHVSKIQPKPITTQSSFEKKKEKKRRHLLKSNYNSELYPKSNQKLKCIHLTNHSFYHNITIKTS